MPDLKCEAEVKPEHLPAYLDKIVDRLRSFQANASRSDRRIEFAFPFGRARVRDLLATAVQVYARQEEPDIRWRGDLSGETRLPQFREMTVVGVTDLTPRMKRIMLAGDDLGRFATFGGMHVRVLFPTARVPEPDWPTPGENGLAVWPPDDRRPTPHAYTVRKLDVDGGWMRVDFLIHEGESVGSHWAAAAVPGIRVGIMGPVGRPVPLDAQWYVPGADETGP